MLRNVVVARRRAGGPAVDLLAKFRFDTAENEPAKKFARFAIFANPSPPPGDPSRAAPGRRYPRGRPAPAFRALRGGRE